MFSQKLKTSKIHQTLLNSKAHYQEDIFFES